MYAAAREWPSKPCSIPAESQRRQSQILLAPMRSFFFFAAAMARSFKGCATFRAETCALTPNQSDTNQVAQNVSSFNYLQPIA